MNLRDLNQTQEAGKVHAGLVLLLFFFFPEIQQCADGLHMYRLSPCRVLWGSPWDIHMNPAQQRWFDVVRPQQLKTGLFGNGFYHQAPTNPGLCQHHQPNTWGRREQAPAPTESNNHIPAAHVWV